MVNMDSELCSKCELDDGSYGPCEYYINMGYEADEDTVMCDCCDECRYDCFLST